MIYISIISYVDYVIYLLFIDIKNKHKNDSEINKEGCFLIYICFGE